MSSASLGARAIRIADRIASINGASDTRSLAIRALGELSRRERKILTTKLALTDAYGASNAAHNGPGSRHWNSWCAIVVDELMRLGVIGGAS